MLLIPNILLTEYISYLKQMKIPAVRFSDYKKWLRYYLDFCDKYPVPDARSDRVRLFCAKLKEKKQSVAQQEQAAHAVSIYFDMLHRRVPASPKGDSGPGKESASPPSLVQSENGALLSSEATKSNKQQIQESYYVSEDAPRYSTVATRRAQYTEAGYQERSASPEWDKVLEDMAAEIKVRHYSRKTLQTYATWSRNFQKFLKDKAPEELSTADVKDYLTFLAVKCKLAASTQNQAFNKAG